MGTGENFFSYHRGSFALVGWGGYNRPSWLAQKQNKGGQEPTVLKVIIPLDEEIEGGGDGGGGGGVTIPVVTPIPQGKSFQTFIIAK